LTRPAPVFAEKSAVGSVVRHFVLPLLPSYRRRAVVMVIEAKATAALLTRLVSKPWV
jgi:hypothetical protein